MLICALNDLFYHLEPVQMYRKAGAVLKKMQIIRDLYGDRRIIIGRDRMDQIKGVEHKLYAFKKFLSDYPGKYQMIDNFHFV